MSHMNIRIKLIITLVQYNIVSVKCSLFARRISLIVVQDKSHVYAELHISSFVLNT